MKILFLDVDGIICLDMRNLDPNCMDQLKRIIDATGCDIVLSSSWRKHQTGMIELEKSFVRYKIPKIFSATGKTMETRADEIMEWLRYATWRPISVQCFAVLDDCNGAKLPNNPGTFFQPNEGERGLTARLADLIIQHLNAKD